MTIPISTRISSLRMIENGAVLQGPDSVEIWYESQTSRGSGILDCHHICAGGMDPRSDFRVDVLMSEMTTEHYLWACAVQVVKQYGAAAPEFIASRVTALAQAGDMAGVNTWKLIAFRLDTIAGQPDEAVN